jgi:predicted nuclease with RNAse H fold
MCRDVTIDTPRKACRRAPATSTNGQPAWSPTITPVSEALAVGVDVGADRLHLVALGQSRHVSTTAVFDPADRVGVQAWFRALPPGSAVAIDGPPAPSVAAFVDDPTVSPKFRRARGCEVELGRQRGIWVSFATGPEPLVGWMAEAATVHGLCAASGLAALETYPHAVYRTLLGRRPAKKSTGVGISERAEALRVVGLDEPALRMWSHDALDAAAAAIVASDYLAGDAVPITCHLDDTTIWLPRSAPR